MNTLMNFAFVGEHSIVKRVAEQGADGRKWHRLLAPFANNTAARSRRHAHPKVKQWLQRHKRFHLHFIPASSSWLNLIERWFGETTRKRIRRGVFKSVKELIEAIEHYVKTNNQNPKPFVWTKRVDEILEKVNRCKAGTVTPH